MAQPHTAPLRHSRSLTTSHSRQYVTFFLGWLFFLSLVFSLTSPTLSSIVLRFKRAFNPPNVESRSIDARAEKSIPTITSSNMSDSMALVFFINLLILTTSATQFASLLAFDSSNGETSCVFLTAWNGLGENFSHILLLVSDPVLVYSPWWRYRCPSNSDCRVPEARFAPERTWCPQMGKLGSMGSAPLLDSFDVSHQRREHGYTPANPKHRNALLL